MELLMLLERVYIFVLLIGNWTASNLDSPVGGSKVLVSASSLQVVKLTHMGTKKYQNNTLSNLPLLMLLYCVLGNIAGGLKIIGVARLSSFFKLPHY